MIFTISLNSYPLKKNTTFQTPLLCQILNVLLSCKKCSIIVWVKFMSNGLQWYCVLLNKLRFPGSRFGFSLRAGFAHPVVLVNTRPSKGETWSMGFKRCMRGELGAWWRRRRRSSSRCREVRRESIPSKSLPFGVGYPGLGRTGSKLAELRRKVRSRGWLGRNKTELWHSFDIHINLHLLVQGNIKRFSVCN